MIQKAPKAKFPACYVELQKKKILVTGGAGFLGSYVVERLKSLGCTNIFVPRSSEYDLRNRDEICRCLQNSRAEVVIHLAAKVGGIGMNREIPGTLFYDNAVMGIECMEQARLYGVEKFIGIGTICSYPKLTPIPFKEKDLWKGYPEETNAPYGIAKKMLLVQSQAYRSQYGFNAITLLSVNLYGPGDNFDLQTSHIIPALLRKFFTAKLKRSNTVILWGDGTPTREFLYVEDAAEAIVLAAQHYDGLSPINLGTGKEISIFNLARLVAELIGYHGKIVWDDTKPNGQPRRCLDVSQAKRYLGFTAKTDLKDGLRKTIQWYQDQFYETESKGSTQKLNLLGAS